MSEKTVLSQNTQPVGKSTSSRWTKNARKILLANASIIVFVILWEIAYQAGWANPRYTSAPSLIITTMYSELVDGKLLTHIGVTLWEFVLGFSIAAIVGILLGFAMSWYRFVYVILDPFVSALYATPRIVLLPLIILTMGIGAEAKVLIVFLTAVFPILINTHTGFSNLDQNLMRVARSFNASNLQLFRTLALPGSVPYIVSGLRLGVAQALIGVIVAEMFVATSGLGYLVQMASSTFQTDLMYVGIILVAAMGMVFVNFLRKIEDHFSSWKVE